MASSTGPQPPYLLHDSVKARINPDYAKFYNENLVNLQQVHLQPVAASRTGGTLILGGGPPLPVGRIHDVSIRRRETKGPDVMVRVFTPEGEAPEKGWPVMIYFHGGGWVLGNIDTENTACTHMSSRARCVVISVDYRLAPEDPFPAAVHDCWETLLWVQSTGNTLLNLDISKAAIGGSSAGGNLTATMCHKALSAPTLVPKFKAQLLIVPVMDNTADMSNNKTYKENEFVPALPAAKMLWYRHHYLPNRSDWANPEASPLFYEDGWAEQPKALIVMGGMDVLRAEGEAYGEKLKKAGVEVKVQIWEGMPHPFMAMDGALQQGKDTITYMVETLKEAFA